MPRNYKRIPGTRKYKDFPQEQLETALEKITQEHYSIRRAAKEYNIPFGTLYNKYKGLHIHSVGRPTLFTNAEEQRLIQCASVCGDWGFPLSKEDLQNLAKNYLDKQGKVIPHLKDNKPGTDWVDGLLKRNKTQICKRVAANIKRARATVSIESLQKFFDNLKVTIEDVPPQNLFNFDETNFADDPGRRLKLYRRGVKYPEQICNFTKSATTVMVCGSASGVLLPPYVIYRSSRMWDTWTENGPKGYPCCEQRCCSQGARYNRTNHGWMEASAFTDWFVSCFLPHARNLEGKKVLIGDNLAAHFTEEVVNLCEANNIAFVCLVPHSTHLIQPLDVCFFRPMKIAWRKALLQWKKQNPRLTALPKEAFPKLLQTTLLTLDKSDTEERGAIKRNLISGFEATGVHPHNPKRVLVKLPGYHDPADDPAETINSTLVDFLKVQRFSGIEKTRKSKRTMRNVEPGKSVATHKTAEAEIEDLQLEATSDISDDEHSLNEDEAEVPGTADETSETLSVQTTYAEGDYVIVKLKAENTGLYKFFAGEITSIVDTDVVSVSFFRFKKGKKLNFFVFPFIKDESIVKTSEIIEKVNSPSSMHRGQYIFKTFEKYF